MPAFKSRARLCLLPTALIATLALASPAAAAEGSISYLPGVSAGTPVGALPPVGVYFNGNFYFLSGELADGDGEHVPVKGSARAVIAQVTWSTPLRILGARYGAGVIQIVADHSFDTRGVGGRKTRSVGLYNTVVQPVILSWQIGKDLHASFSQNIYVNDGARKTTGGVRDQDSYANNYWTFEPSVGISYIPKGWNLTAYVLYDLATTKNKKTDYKVGNIFYVDLTATHQSGKFVYGLVGTATQQVTDDRLHGVAVPGGNRSSHIQAGPLLSYNFPKFSVTAKYFANLHARNDLSASIGYLSIATKF